MRLLLFLVLVCLALSSDREYKSALKNLSSAHRSAAKCSTSECRFRVTRKAKAMFRRAVRVGRKVRRTRRNAWKRCADAKCRDKAEKALKEFCNEFRVVELGHYRFLQARCSLSKDREGCRDKLDDRIAKLSVAKCVGSLKVTTTKAKTTTIAPTKKSTTMPKPTKTPVDGVCAVMSTAWNEEFKKRSAEHAKLFRLHNRGSLCVTHRCTRRIERLRIKLTKAIRKDRNRRRRQLKLIRCPTTVAPVLVKESKKVVAAVEKKEKKKRRSNRNEMGKKESSCTQLEVTLNLEIANHYVAIDQCDSENCKEKLNQKIDQAKARLDKLGDCEEKKTTKSNYKKKHSLSSCTKLEVRLNLKIANEYMKVHACRDDEKCVEKGQNMIDKTRARIETLKDCVDVSLEKTSTDLINVPSIAAVNAAVLAAIRSAEKNSQSFGVAGDAAISLFHSRVLVLKSRREFCNMLKSVSRQIKCRWQVTRDRNNLRLESRTLTSLRQCEKKFRGSKRRLCIEKYRRKLLSLLSRPSHSALLRTLTAKPGRSNKKIRNATPDKVNGAVVQAVESVLSNSHFRSSNERAIRRFQNRLRFLRKRERSCAKYSENKKRRCVAWVAKERRVIKQESLLLDNIDRCRSKFPKDKRSRTRCTRRYGSHLFSKMNGCKSKYRNNKRQRRKCVRKAKRMLRKLMSKRATTRSSSKRRRTRKRVAKKNNKKRVKKVKIPRNSFIDVSDFFTSIHMEDSITWRKWMRSSSVKRILRRFGLTEKVLGSESSLIAWANKRSNASLAAFMKQWNQATNSQYVWLHHHLKCGRADLQRWNKKRAMLNERLARLYDLVTKCKDSKCSSKHTNKISRTYKQLEQLKRPTCGSFTKRPRDTPGRMEKMYSNNRYFRELRRRLRQCSNKKCRRNVFVRFRREIDAKQRALYQHLHDMAKERVTRDIATCVRRYANAASKKKRCLKKVENWERRRLAYLRVRILNIDRNREKRLCRMTNDPLHCRAQVQNEYARDILIAAEQAKLRAEKDVKKIEKKELAASSSSSTKKTSSTVRMAAAFPLSYSLTVLATFLFVAICLV